MKQNTQIKETIQIPSSVFKDRKLAVLEVIVEYLKEDKKMTCAQIAKTLNRNDRTIWTVYRRAKIKRSGIIKTENKKE